ncbi:uncharacterized protein PFL1_02970 [Pseudozyma flocculosa PF-1]|uniref:Alpha/beta-hydrolase n=2 Tax=Pseudozyma flocculosa TaxID=84751 RepID=A0A5C3F1E3_9BASI|nr:uncharacterized protein PFL1_02970 [Pseudozyma flocculosa PF-1]EPQ29751.1 hypothetical protein PFL1_02970 [Pseudozyma flocculosa PF-1]SPO38333.1 uncharacterized protein PSFLO_03810 [Pseudozyma flocculosa]
MLLSTRSLLLSLLAAPFALAAPSSPSLLATRAAAVPPTTDAPFSVSAATVQGAIECPFGIQRKPGGIVYLIHGTGSTGKESWGSGPWVSLLPNLGPGFDVCYVTLPDRSQGDAQISAEYVARGVQFLAPQSATGKVSLVGHSQGNLNIEWALAFWPVAARSLTAEYIALAADFQGTLDGILYCSATKILEGGCPAAEFQQSTGSHFVNTLRKATANSALVPTASIYTIYDEVVTPEVGPGATSVINKASLYPLQDLDICGPLHPAEHFSMIIDPAAFEIGYKSLVAGKPIARSAIDKRSCIDFYYGTGFNNNTFAKGAELLEAIVKDVVSFPTADVVKAEPAIKAYAAPYAA